MAAGAKNTAREGFDVAQDPRQEPSMEEILASIKQIIADDEESQVELNDRDQYTHPTDHSNTNDLSIEMDTDFEAALAAELSDPAPIEMPGVVQQPTAVAVTNTLESRAQKVREDIAQSAVGLSADEKLEQYRVRGKLKMESLAESPSYQRLDLSRRVSAETPPLTVRSAAIPTQSMPAPVLPATSVIVEKMAATMMSEKASEIENMLGDMMKPIVRKWLGDNLPTLVEKLVREEIEKVSRAR